MEGIAAPGARVLIRDEEWLVRSVDPSSDGGDLLVCDGVSDLVRGRTAHFLTRREERIELLHPAQTRLVQDDSSHFNASMLYIEGVPDGTVIDQTVEDDTLPNGPHKKVRAWTAPFALANREEDYRIAWEFFETDGVTAVPRGASQ